MLMEMAWVVSKRGTCSRLQVGAIVSRDGRVISTGYNGAPAGLPHCDHIEEVQSDWPLEDPGCQIAEHAERNAIAFAARYGMALEGSELHTTHAPCLNCSRMIINSGIICVTYQKPYRITTGVELLQAARVQVREYSA